jgi:two-component system chemotaxis response regulator CheB
VMDRMLSARTMLKVKFAESGEALKHGTVYLAPADYHLLVKDGHVALSHGPRENRSRPAIDPLFRSAAVAHTTRVIGVILTGMLDDGTTGLQAIKECGGIAVVQDPKDAESKEMPESALRAVDVDYKATLASLGGLLMKLVETRAPAAAKVPESLKLEVKISQGMVGKDMEKNIVGELVPIVCPECGGTLSEIRSGKGFSYRCHEGHAYGKSSLLNAQEEKMEYALWAAVRVLDEQANMLVRLGARERPPSISRRHYEQRAKEIQSHASQIRDFLLHTAGERV